MPKMIPTIRVGVARPINDKKDAPIRIKHPDIGVLFDFTADEVRDLNKAHPGAVRKPVNEGGVTVDPVQTPDVPLEREDGGDTGKVNKTDGEDGGGKDGGTTAEDDDL